MANLEAQTIVNVGANHLGEQEDATRGSEVLVKLRSQLERLAETEKSRKILDKFEEMRALEAPLEINDYAIAVQAAEQTGEAWRVSTYILQAKRVFAGGNNAQLGEMDKTMASLAMKYGNVSISSREKVSSFEAKTPPTDEKEIQAIKFAAAQLKKNRFFLGFLPAGKYILNDEQKRPITVTMGGLNTDAMEHKR